MSLDTALAIAIEAYDGGYPSLLPDGNPYKVALTGHRWGWHDTPKRSCPICQRTND